MRWWAFVLILVFASDAFAQAPPVVLAPGSVVGNSFATPNFGSAFPSGGVALGFKNVGGNMDYAIVDPSHNVDVNCITGCSAAGASTVTVSGVATVAPAVGLGGTFPVQGVPNGVGIGVYPARFPMAPSLALESGNLLSIANAVAGISGCAGQSVANTKVAVINLASTTAAQLVPLVQGKQVYICALDLVTAIAQNVALIEGTQVTNPCDTNTAGMAGGSTASAGWNFIAPGGLTKGNGQGIVYKTATLGHQVCLLSSGTGQISGEITYAQF